MSAWPQEDGALAPVPRGEHRADVVVIGGGITGLSAALHLLRLDPARSVVLLEADRVGAGATGRSTGMVGPGVGDVLDLRRRHGDDVAAAMVRATTDAVRLVVDLARDEGIECDLVENGQVHAALTAAHARRRFAELAAWTALGADARWLAADELAAATGTRAYAGGLRLAPAALVDPARLCRGLRDAVLRRGGRVHEGAPVRHLEPGRPARVVAGEATFSAPRVVLATNAFTPRLGLLERALVPLHARALVTAPLPEGFLAALGGPGRDAVIDARSFFHYHRLTPDGRLLLGGAPLRRRQDDPEDDALAWGRLRRELQALFPALGPVQVAARWSGPLAFTWDRLPIVGPVDGADGLLVAGGWCGHGLALGAAAGAALARHVVDGAALPALPWTRGGAPAPVRPVGDLLVATTIPALDAVDRATTRWPPRRRRVKA